MLTRHNQKKTHPPVRMHCLRGAASFEAPIVSAESPEKLARPDQWLVKARLALLMHGSGRP
jgi:hypothetical protein